MKIDMTTRHIFSLLTLCFLLLAGAGNPLQAQDPLTVVTTLPDLEDITRRIGGEQVNVTSVATGYQNPHFVDPKPSYITRLSRADMFVTVGLDLEVNWVRPLLQSARNSQIQQGAPGYVDASTGIPLLDVPESVSRAQGDIHIYGNPHYWLDPRRGKMVAENIHDALVNLQPENEELFSKNLEQFKQEIDRRLQDWQEQMEPYKGATIIAYHDQWPYFAERFGLNIAGFMEPKPGIPPTPSQLAKVIQTMQQQNIKVIIIAPYYETDSAELVAERTNGEVVRMASSVGSYDGIETYFDLFDYNIEQIINAFESTGQGSASSQ